MEAFTIRDLRERTGELIRGAETGKLSVVTKHGKPVFVAVPLDEHLLEAGVRVSLAVKLYEEEVLSLGKAARFAGLSVEAFLDKLDARGIPAVRYEPQELDTEIAAIKADSPTKK